MTQTRRYASYWLIGLVLALFTFVSDATVQSSQICVPPPPGLVSWWPGDGDANDITDGNHGTLQNGATFAAGLVGQAFSFVGPFDFVRVTHDSNLNVGTGDVTIDAWTKLSNTTFTDDKVIMSKVAVEVGAEPFPGYTFRWLGDKLQFIIDSELGGVGPSVQDKKVEATITRDTLWHHVSAVRRGLTMELYYDGVLVATATHSSFENADNNASVAIGNNTDHENGFPGLIDELEFFKRALAAGEIAAIYNAGSAGKCKDRAPTLIADADNFLRSGANNTNEGANERLRIQSSGHNRALVQFDLSGISTAGLQSAILVLNIAENSNNWGSIGRLVDVHPLLEDWIEGNGNNAVVVSGAPSFRGSGEGVTWRCASDSDISNQQADCASPWDGGAFASATAAGVLHTNGLLGEVSWDVTEDVMAGANFGWLVKKREEGQPGQVRYFSREGAARVGDVSLAPRLILVYTQ